MGAFTSRYKINDGSLFGRTETRVDAGKSIDAGVTALTYLLVATIGIWISSFLWLMFKTLKEPGWLFYSFAKSKLQIPLSVAQEFNISFINAYSNAINEKK